MLGIDPAKSNPDRKERTMSSETTILEQAFQRGRDDAQKGHPGPDAADVADFIAPMLQARSIPDFGNEIDAHGNIVNPIDTSRWTDNEWNDYRSKVQKVHSDVSDAYAKGADAK
jgi:hypothetical protein